MKVLLSWLRRASRRSSDDAVALADDAERPRARRSRTSTRVGERLDGVVIGRGAAHRAAPRRRPRSSGSYVDAGDGASAAGLVRRVQHAAGDVVPLATLGTTMPDGRTIEPAQASSASTPTACSARRASSASATTTPASSSCPPTCRSACPTARRSASRPTSCSTSRSPATGPTAWGYVGVARDLAAKLGVPFAPAARRRRSPSATPRSAPRSRSSTATAAGGSRSTVLSGVARRPVGRRGWPRG